MEINGNPIISFYNWTCPVVFIVKNFNNILLDKILFFIMDLGSGRYEYL